MRREIPFRMPDGSTNWLQPGSRAHQLQVEGKAKELVAHMKDVQARHDALTMPTPMEQLQDRIKGGFKPGELFIVAARRAGKSWFNEEIARQALEKSRG